MASYLVRLSRCLLRDKGTKCCIIANKTNFRKKKYRNHNVAQLMKSYEQEGMFGV